MFTFLCGFSICDYVRYRRLSKAAEDLITTSDRIIDIAFKYGYDTPEGFSRAFSKFHKVTPMQARKGANVVTFSRLSVKLSIDGGNKMDYRIEKKEAFKVICKKIQATKDQMGNAAEDISKFWEKCSKDGTTTNLCKYGKFDSLKGVIGICFSKDIKDQEFPYGIGVEYNGIEGYPDEFEVVEIPAYTFAAFTCKGKIPDAFIKTYNQIVTEFWPQSHYEYGAGVELEVYPSNNVQDPNYSFEIWVSVTDKK